jgi:tyrosine-protein kinase Etk/Wzc
MDKGFSLLNVAIVLLRRKRMILAHFLGIVLASILVSLVIPKTYKATTLFMPPYSDVPRLSTLSLSMALNLGGESPFTPNQIESLLDSRKILEGAVEHFDLMRIYKTAKYPNRMEKALKKLRSNIKLKVNTESGLTQNSVVDYSLSVVDKDRQRAADIANFLVASLNVSMNELSKNIYGYSVEFIKGRLDSVEYQKLLNQKKLAEFQKTNKVYSPEMKEQVLASVATYAELKKEKIMSEIERDLLLFDREKNNRDVQFADRKIRELEGKMKRIESDREPAVLPGLEHSVDIAYDYLNLVQEAEVLVKLEMLLRQQYEEARIKNARQVPGVRVIDAAVPPEWKNFPKKSIIVGVMVGVYMFLLIVSILLAYGVGNAPEETRRRLGEFREALRLRASR